jgi:hypothetical protein
LYSEKRIEVSGQPDALACRVGVLVSTKKEVGRALSWCWQFAVKKSLLPLPGIMP